MGGFILRLTISFFTIFILGQTSDCLYTELKNTPESLVMTEILLPKNFPIYFPIPNIEHSKTASFSAKMQKKSKSEPVFAQICPFWLG